MSIKKQNGITLIEVMISVFVAAIGVLGVAALQMNSIKFNHMANTRSHATMLAYDIIDRMRANRQQALAGAYDTELKDNPPTGKSIADADIATWLNELSGNLPSGDGSIESDGSTFTVTVQWDESRLDSTRVKVKPENYIPTESFVFVTEL